MRKLVTSLLFLVSLAATAQWQPDILGDGFESRAVIQPDDYAGPVRSTIIRHKSACPDSHRAVLYVHGYNDYFFQKDMAERFADSCYNFYAVDLRKYGRSILPENRKFQAHNISEYYADIDSAIAQMQRDGMDEIYLMGHSTGGLVTSSYMNARPESSVRALILNSPFLDWNLKGPLRQLGIPFVASLAPLMPGKQISNGDSDAYAQSLLKQYHGEWEYNTDWKTVKPEKVEASWIKTINDAQKDLDLHSAIMRPILLMHSDKSVYGDDWSPDHQRGDAVLNVEHISERGRRLGPDVREVVIDDGLHDLMLSSPQPREKAYRAVFDFLDSVDQRNNR